MLTDETLDGLRDGLVVASQRPVAEPARCLRGQRVGEIGACRVGPQGPGKDGVEPMSARELLRGEWSEGDDVGDAGGLCRPPVDEGVPGVEGDVIEWGRNDHREAPVWGADQSLKGFETLHRGVLGLGAERGDVCELDDVEELVRNGWFPHHPARVAAGDRDLKPTAAKALDGEHRHDEGAVPIGVPDSEPHPAALARRAVQRLRPLGVVWASDFTVHREVEVQVKTVTQPRRRLVEHPIQPTRLLLRGPERLIVEVRGPRTRRLLNAWSVGNQCGTGIHWLPTQWSWRHRNSVYGTTEHLSWDVYI